MAATALVVSCSDTNSLNEVEETPIGFANTYIGKITKANAGEMTGGTGGTLFTNGNTMEVWGWKNNPSSTTIDNQVFDDQVVTYNASLTGGTTKWEYSPLKYWDRAASYKFYAVAPHDKFTINEVLEDANATNRKFQATAVPTIQTLMDNNGTSKIKLATDDSGAGTKSTAIDYLVAAMVSCAAGASNQGNNTTDHDVDFTFNHILSKLNVKVVTSSTFNNTSTTYPQIKLNKLDLKIAGLANQYDQKTAGSVTPAATDGDIWTGESAEATITSFNADGTTVAPQLLSTTAFDAASYFIAPTKTGTTSPEVAAGTSTVKIQATYTIYYDGGSDPTSSEVCMSDVLTIENLTRFGQNTVNNLTITIDPKAIYFDVVTVNDWSTEGQEGTITVQ